MNPIQSELQICMIPIAECKPAPYNPRKKIPPQSQAYRKLRASLETFGLVEPLIWNQRTGFIVGGHLRLTILRELGWEVIPVSVVDLDPHQEKALNVVLNNREAQGRYDLPKLRELLGELQPLGNLESTGFDAEQLAELQPLESATERPSAGQFGAERIEITLFLSLAQFETAKAEIDRLIRQYDLESHLRRNPITAND